MATTANDAIKRALRLIRAIDPTEEPEAEDGQTGIEALNQMAHNLEEDGIYLDFEDIQLTDDLPFPKRTVRSIIYLLAAELAPEYGKELTPEVAVEARASKKKLQAWYKRRIQSRPELAITNRLSRYGNVYNIKTDGV